MSNSIFGLSYNKQIKLNLFPKIFTLFLYDSSKVSLNCGYSEILESAQQILTQKVQI